MSRRIGSLVFLGLILVSPMLALSQGDIIGTWKGDKALGDVVLLEKGEGYLVFESDHNLTMQLSYVLKEGKFQIGQAEKNRKEFYLAFNPFFAPQARLSDANAVALAKQARPFAWTFTLSGDGKTLQGAKETTKFGIDGFGSITIDNGYSRDATWTRLKGRLDSPGISVSGEAKKLVSFTHAEAGVQYFYTRDGTCPIADASAAYTAPIQVDKTEEIQVIASKPGYMSSNITRQRIEVGEAVPNKPAPVAAAPKGGKPGFYEDFSGYDEGAIPELWFGIDKFMVKKVDARKFLVPMTDIGYSGAKISTPRIVYPPNYRVEIELMTQAWMNGTSLVVACEQFVFGINYCDRFGGQSLASAQGTFINDSKGPGVSFPHTSVISLAAEKQGDVVSLFFNGQKIHFMRIVPTDKTGGITITIGGSNAFNSFFLKKVAVTEL